MMGGSSYKVMPKHRLATSEKLGRATPTQSWPGLAIQTASIFPYIILVSPTSV